MVEVLLLYQAKYGEELKRKFNSFNIIDSKDVNIQCS